MLAGSVHHTQEDPPVSNAGGGESGSWGMQQRLGKDWKFQGYSQCLCPCLPLVFLLAGISVPGH